MSETRSIFQIAVARLGPIKGARVVVFIGMWSLAMYKAGDRWDLMGEVARADAYADAYVCSRATAYRHLKLYGSVFKLDPTDMVRALSLEVENRRQAKDVWGIGMRALP